MRSVIIAAVLLAAGIAAAQDAPRVVTFADLERNRPAWAGDLVRVNRVVVFGFSQGRGGLVRDDTSGAKIDDEGMTPRTIYSLERNCSRASNTGKQRECRGSLIFKVTLREELRGGFTIRGAEFIPE